MLLSVDLTLFVQSLYHNEKMGKYEEQVDCGPEKSSVPPVDGSGGIVFLHCLSVCSCVCVCVCVHVVLVWNKILILLCLV